MKDLYLISNDCWSTGVYKKYKSNYNSPFVNVLIHLPCYIKLLKRFDYYISCGLNFISFKDSQYNSNNQRYIIGKLDDIEIHFTHEPSINELKMDNIKKTWNRRKNRLSTDYNNLIFKFSDVYHYKPHFYDKDFEQYLELFYNLPYKNKISFTNKLYNYPNNFILKPNHVNDALKLGVSVDNYLNLRSLNE